MKRDKAVCAPRPTREWLARVRLYNNKGVPRPYMAVQTWPKAGRHTVRPYSDRTFLQSPHDAYGSFYLVYHQAQPQDAGLHPRLRTAVHIGQTERGRSPTVCCRMGSRSAGMLLKPAGRHKRGPLPEPFLTRASHARPCDRRTRRQKKTGALGASRALP